MDSVHLEEGDSDTPSSDNTGSLMTESVYGKLSNSTLKVPKKHRSKSMNKPENLLPAADIPF